MNQHFLKTHRAGTPPPPQHPQHQPSQDDQDWVLTAAIMLLLIQVGYALRASGSVKYKNTQTMVLKIMIGSTFGLLAWWIIGYAFAFSNQGHIFVGTQKFFTYKFQADDFANWVFSAGCAIASTNIVVQAGAERLQFGATAVIALFYTVFSYALCAHWNFGKGWLNSLGYKDFAGCGTISLVGGSAALITTILLKPRKDRFTSTTYPRSFNPPFVGFGTLLTFVGWIFLTSGFVTKGDKTQLQQGLVLTNTLLGAAGGFVGAVCSSCCALKKEKLISASNGLLAGVVAVSAACDNIETWSAIIFGLLGGLTYHILSNQFIKLEIDDPVDVSAIHFGGGLVGLFLTGLLDQRTGLIYGQGGKQIGNQLVGICAQILWSYLVITIPIMLLKGMGKYRIDEDTEKAGMDIAQCGGEAIVFQSEAQVTQLPQTKVEPQQKVELQTQPNQIGRIASSRIYK